MTPDERQMISGLFDRMRQQGAIEKDRDAEALIRDTIRQMPDAPYMMVQSVLVQEMALQQTQTRVQQLEDQVRDLQAQSRPAPQSTGAGSFLGGLFGGGSKPASVPSSGHQQSSGFGGAAPRAGSPWGQSPGAQPMQQQPMQQQPMQQMPMQAQGGGGGFMRSAMTTAAGVAGGMLAANAISNMMGGHSAAHAAPATPAAAPAAPAAAVDDHSGQAATQNDDNDPGDYDDNDPGDFSGSDE